MPHHFKGTCMPLLIYIFLAPLQHQLFFCCLPVSFFYVYCSLQYRSMVWRNASNHQSWLQTDWIRYLWSRFHTPCGEEIGNAEDEYQEQNIFHYDQALTPSSTPHIPQLHGLIYLSQPRTHIVDEHHQSVATRHQPSKGNQCSAHLYAEYTSLAVRRPKQGRVDWTVDLLCFTVIYSKSCYPVLSLFDTKSKLTSN